MQLASDVNARAFPAVWRELQDSLRKALVDRFQPGQVPSHARASTGVQVRGARARLVLRDNLRNRRKIERAYLDAIDSAHDEVIVANAYFLPGASLRRSLIRAARRGVRVRLLLQGRYEYFMQFYASRAVYAELLAAGVQIYEYQASFLHAKVAVIDGHWATVGSSNLDPLSLLLAREANVVIDDAAFADKMHACITHALAHSSKGVDAEALGTRSLRERVRERLALGLMRLALLLTRNRY